MARPLFRAALLLLAAALPHPLQAQFSVYPVNVELRAEQGSVTEVVNIRNDGAEPLSALLSFEDFDMSESGEHSFAPSGELAPSCKDRVRVFPSDVTIAPGATQTVRLEMQPGAEGCWSVLWITNAARKVLQGASIGTRIGVKVYGITPSAAAEGEILGSKVTHADGKNWFVVSLRNAGNAVMRPTGKLEIFRGTEVAATVPVNAFSVLPGHVYHFRIEMPELPAGEYTLVPSLDYGGDYVMVTRLRWTMAK